MLSAKNMLPKPLPFEIQYFEITVNINKFDAFSTLNCQTIDNIKLIKPSGPSK